MWCELLSRFSSVLGSFLDRSVDRNFGKPDTRGSSQSESSVAELGSIVCQSEVSVRVDIFIDATRGRSSDTASAGPGLRILGGWRPCFSYRPWCS